MLRSVNTESTENSKKGECSWCSQPSEMYQNCTVCMLLKKKKKKSQVNVVLVSAFKCALTLQLTEVFTCCSRFFFSSCVTSGNFKSSFNECIMVHFNQHCLAQLGSAQSGFIFSLPLGFLPATSNLSIPSIHIFTVLPRNVLIKSPYK